MNFLFYLHNSPGKQVLLFHPLVIDEEIKVKRRKETCLLLLLLLSRFSRIRLCVTPQMAAHQAPPSPGFSRQEHWSGFPFPSPMHEIEKWK